MGYRTISVDVDLDQLYTPDLIDELVYRKVLTREQGKSLKEKKEISEEFLNLAGADEAALDRALEEMSRGRAREALIYFERAIPALKGICSLVDL